MDPTKYAFKQDVQGEKVDIIKNPDLTYWAFRKYTRLIRQMSKSKKQPE